MPVVCLLHLFLFFLRVSSAPTDPAGNAITAAVILVAAGGKTLQQTKETVTHGGGTTS